MRGRYFPDFASLHPGYGTELARDLLLRQREDAGAFNDGHARRDKTVRHGKVAPSNAGMVAIKSSTKRAGDAVSSSGLNVR